jgi:hypothetical protein
VRAAFRILSLRIWVAMKNFAGGGARHRQRLQQWKRVDPA